MDKIELPIGIYIVSFKPKMVTLLSSHLQISILLVSSDEIFYNDADLDLKPILSLNWLIRILPENLS